MIKMQLHCQACNQLIPARDVNIDLGVARCLACNEVFRFLDLLGVTARSRPIVRTVIRVSAGELSVNHGPVPCLGNCRLPAADVKQLFCTEKRGKGEDCSQRTYNVVALRQDDSQVTLVSNLEELDQAWFIEQRLEEHLKVQDERVPGEASCRESF